MLPHGTRAITVSVDFSDLLAVTLSVNHQHFDEVLVVTASHDDATKEVVEQIGLDTVRWFATDLFYRDGAAFNKGRALERGFNELGRHGWITILDADVLMPQQFSAGPIEPGGLFCPRRRIVRDLRQWQGGEDWSCFPQVPDFEHAGYFQLFHADDPVLAEKPWYGVDYKHAGRCDSYFQERWPVEKRHWMQFEVLHLGEDTANWMGRCTPFLNGLFLPGSDRRRRAMSKMLAACQAKGANGHEKISITPTLEEDYL